MASAVLQRCGIADAVANRSMVGLVFECSRRQWLWFEEVERVRVVGRVDRAV